MELKVFLVNIPIKTDGPAEIWVGGEVRAETREDAELIAEENGYELLGPLVEVVEISDEELDAISETMKPEVIH